MLKWSVKNLNQIKVFWSWFEKKLPNVLSTKKPIDIHLSGRASVIPGIKSTIYFSDQNGCEIGGISLAEEAKVYV